LPVIEEDTLVTEEERALISSGVDVNTFVLWVLRESYLIQTDVLKDYADKVKQYNDLKDRARQAISDARQAKLDYLQEETKAFYEATPYLLFMASDSSSEETQILTTRFSASDLGTANSFLGSTGLGNYRFESATVPEPSMLMLVSVGLVGLGIARIRRSKKIN